MTEPTRLRELAADNLRARLVRSAAPDAPPQGAHQRAIAALGLTASITASTAAAAQAAPKSMLALVIKWLGFGAIAGAVASTVAGKTIDAWTTASPAASQRTLSAQASPAIAPVPAAEEARETNDDNPALGSSSAPARVSPSSARAMAAGPTSSAENKPADSLADELAMVDRAREALASGNPAGAMAALDRYQSTYRRARLSDESTELRIEALLAKGNRAEAKALANRFLSERPNSPLSQRVRTLISESALDTR